MENITLRVASKHNSPTTITTRQAVREKQYILNGKPQSNMFFTQHSFPLIENILWHRLLLTSSELLSVAGSREGKTKASVSLNNFLGRQHQKINPFHQLITHVPCAELYFPASYLHKILWMRCLHCSCIGQIPITMISTCSESFPDGFLSEMRNFPAHRRRGAFSIAFTSTLKPNRGHSNHETQEVSKMV